MRGAGGHAFVTKTRASRSAEPCHVNADMEERRSLWPPSQTRYCRERPLGSSSLVWRPVNEVTVAPPRTDDGQKIRRCKTPRTSKRTLHLRKLADPRRRRCVLDEHRLPIQRRWNHEHSQKQSLGSDKTPFGAAALMQIPIPSPHLEACALDISQAMSAHRGLNRTERQIVRSETSTVRIQSALGGLRPSHIHDR